MKINIILFFLLFFSICQLYAQFTGGTYDGFDVYTISTPSNLNGDTVNELKYSGGNYDGYTLISGIIMNLDGLQINSTKYAGGSFDGYFFSTSALINLDGHILFVDSKYFGGSYDGYSSGVSSMDISLPVTLTVFNLSEILHQTTVIIEWRTEAELENAYWLLLRKTENDTLKTLQKFPGNGNKSSVSDYVYRDSDIEAGGNYTYQLADVSYNGVINYHKEKSIAVSVPRSFELFQNFPNPFNPGTNINFSLPITARVQLKIYNILGQKVIDLLDEHKKAGYHKVKWDGKNSHGEEIASGVYIYLMYAKGIGKNEKNWFQNVKRMILVR